MVWPLTLAQLRSSASRVSPEGRNRQIVAAHRAGVPVCDIAHAARLSVTQTRRIIAKEQNQ